ncbi:MAG: RES domain-containing protein [Lachnospiraceae bacterium]|nr:RES domain-containing protein [Lachnospiraceae bacterium]
MDKIIDIYKDLLEEQDIIRTISKYFAGTYLGIPYDFGSSLVKEGTKLYRIRSFHEGKDYSNVDEWKPSPRSLQNRCNANNEKAIYLGSTEWVCLLETHKLPGEKYVLGEYTVIKDIVLGGFTNVKPNESVWKIITAMAFNAFLIAPARSEKNRKLFEIIDNSFDDIDFSTINIKTITTADNHILPYRLARLFKKENYYMLTNMLCDTIKQRYPNGIRYSSCFIPVETVGIECTEYNIVLYDSAVDSIKFNEYTIKDNQQKATPEGIAEILLKCKET